MVRSNSQGDGIQAGKDKHREGGNLKRDNQTERPEMGYRIQVFTEGDEKQGRGRIKKKKKKKEGGNALKSHHYLGGGGRKSKQNA